MDKVVYKVDGLDCAEEITLLRKVLGKEKGIVDLEFNLVQAKIGVFYNPNEIDSGEIALLIQSTGMKPTLWEKRLLKDERSFWTRHKHLILTCISGFFLFLAIFTHFILNPKGSFLMGFGLELGKIPFWAKIFYSLSTLSGIWLTLPKAFYSLRKLRADMNLLMVVAVFGALAIQEWFEAAAVAFLFSLALLLESWSVKRARKEISALLALSPKSARVMDLKTETLIEKKIEDVEIGEIIWVRPGEKIPLDGIIIEGVTSVDQSPITGESIPVLKQVGDEIFAGTLNEEGAIEYRVTKKSQETTLAKIIHLVEEARSKRSESEAWVETFARFYTPIMLLLSLFVMLLFPLIFKEPFVPWIYRGLILLVIACPCALVISTPVSIVAGLTSAAKAGILIKGGIFLEEVGKLRAVALDKTGTLTYGNLEVQEIVPLNNHTEKKLMEIAASLETPSEHPIARAILKKSEEMEIEVVKASNFQIIKGKGALATYKDKLYWIGSHRFMHEMGQETDLVHQKALELEDAGHTFVAIGTKDHVSGLISLADSPRKWIKETLEAIRALGVREIVMLTGDNEPTARALALFAGVDRFHAELVPEEKVDLVLALEKKWEKVGMIGDGINDAPAMAAATVGFAMGKMGTDAAIETADIAFMSDELSRLPWLIKHSRKVLRIIKQNIAFSLGVKAIFIILALLNIATLWMAIAADTGATLLVISNALRLLKHPI